jgi:uncharacterized protein YjiS (DUF1127 family)
LLLNLAKALATNNAEVFKMLEDIKFDLQTLDFRALGQTEWAELKQRLEQRARAERSHAIRAVTDGAFTRMGRLASATSSRISEWRSWLGLVLVREWQAHALAHQRQQTVAKLRSLDDLRLKDIGLRRADIQFTVYRHDPGSFR